MTGPGRRDTHDKWEKREKLGRDSAPASKDERFALFVEKRWTVQTEPFRGFNSPPGRF